MRDSVGGVYLPDDLLCLVWGVVDVEQGGHLSTVLHVLPVVDVEFNHLAVQLAQMRASLLVDPENGVFNGKVQRHCGGQRNLCLFTLLKEGFQQSFKFFMKNEVYSSSKHCLNISQVFEGVCVFVVDEIRSEKCFWSHMKVEPVRKACPVLVEVLIYLAHYDKFLSGRSLNLSWIPFSTFFKIFFHAFRVQCQKSLCPSVNARA